MTYIYTSHIGRKKEDENKTLLPYGDGDTMDIETPKVTVFVRLKVI